MKYMIKFCNISGMPIFEGKRLELIGVKYNADEKKQFEEIGEIEDRPLSYVVRELSLRGLVQYLQDKKVKVSSEEIEIARSILNSEGKELKTKSKTKIPIKKEKDDAQKNKAA